MRLELVSLIRRAALQHKEMHTVGLRVQSNGGHHIVNVSVRPLTGIAGLRGTALVSFEDAETAKANQTRTRLVPLGNGVALAGEF